MIRFCLALALVSLVSVSSFAQIAVGVGDNGGANLAAGILIGQALQDDEKLPRKGRYVLKKPELIGDIAAYYEPKMAYMFERPKLAAEIERIAKELDPSRDWKARFYYLDYPIAVAGAPNSIFMSSAMLSYVAHYEDLVFLTAFAISSVKYGLFDYGEDPENTKCRETNYMVKQHQHRAKRLDNTRFLPTAEQFAHTYAGMCWADYRMYSPQYYTERQWMMITSDALRNMAKLGVKPERGFDFLLRRYLLLEGEYYGVYAEDEALEEVLEYLEENPKKWQQKPAETSLEFRDVLPYLADLHVAKPPFANEETETHVSNWYMGLINLGTKGYALQQQWTNPEELLISEKVAERIMVAMHDNLAGVPFDQKWRELVQARIDDDLVVGDWRIISWSYPLPYEALDRIISTSDATIGGFPGVKVSLGRDMGSAYLDTEFYYVERNGVVYEIMTDSDPYRGRKKRRQKFLNAFKFGRTFNENDMQFSLRVVQPKTGDSWASVSERYYGMREHEYFLALYNGRDLGSPLPKNIKVPRVAPERYGEYKSTRKVKRKLRDKSLRMANEVI